MSKVFTITEGLETTGSMKTGGQGSVYKGRRIGPIITAVKLLPTPIFGDESEDKNFRDFKNEVQKLKRVNEKPNPNVVKILGSGLSETGNFPFIEMEYIEGPDLEELLQAPHDPVFTIKEVIKVAEQLSNALAHCHSLGVKHGDIKSNNVKFNIHTGNYVLLDFGLAVMSDEQRRTSLRHAGAVEFMAPEQNEGQMLFQTDVYSFGIVLFELLGGRVPFPLRDKGETARNNVRLAHMESLPPDVISLRKERLPLTWAEDKAASEMNIPDWVTNVIYKCLNKRPENRFADGIELNTFITQNSVHVLNAPNMAHQSALLLKEKQQLQKQLLQYRDELALKERECQELRTTADNKSKVVQLLEVKPRRAASDETSVAKSSFIAVLFLAIALAAFSGYSYFKDIKQEKELASKVAATRAKSGSGKAPVTKKKTPGKKDVVVNKRKPAETAGANSTSKSSTKKANTEPAKDKKENKDNNPKAVMPDKPADRYAAMAGDRYTVISKAYFHNTPDESSRREAFINQWNDAVLTPQDDMHGFIYVVYTNVKGQTSRGWLRKKDLRKLN